MEFIVSPERIAIHAAAVAACAAAGFRNIELPLARIRSERLDLKALLHRHELRCIAGCSEQVVCFGDAGASAASHARIIADAALLAELGGGVLVLGTDGPSCDPSLIALDAIGRTLLSLVGKTPPTVSLAIEFGASPIVKSLRSAKIVCDVANHPRIGICFDLAHYHCSASKLEDLAPAVAEKILHVHVTDMPTMPGELCDCHADRLLPGDPRGSLDLRAILGRMEALGYRGFFSLEVPAAADALPRCYAAMKSLCD